MIKMRKILFPMISSLLFLSLAFFPLIEGETKTDVTKEIAIEIHTPQGITELTKELPIETVEKLSFLLEYESIDKALFELKKHGLLGDFSISEVKELITGKYQQKTRIMEKIGDLLNTSPGFDNGLVINAFCSFITSHGNAFGFFPYNLPLLFYFLFNEEIGDRPYLNLIFIYFVLYPSLMVDYIPHPTTLGLWRIFAIGHGVGASVYTKGLFGERSIWTTVDINVVTVGFSGIVIIGPGIIQSRAAIGFALSVIAREQK